MMLLAAVNFGYSPAICWSSVSFPATHIMPKYCERAGLSSPKACCAERPDSSASSRARIAVGATAFDILPTRGVLEAGQTCIVEFAYYARPGQMASTTAVCSVEGGPTYTLPVSADSNAIKYRPPTMCMHATTHCGAADL